MTSGTEVAPKGSREFYDVARREAHRLYVEGRSLREIAEVVLPNRKGAFVTVQRWSAKPDEETGLTWKQEKAAVEAEARELDRQRYLAVVQGIKDDNLKIAAKARMAVEMALDNYFLYDEGGRIVGMRTNQYGNPIINPRDISPLINAFNELQTRTLGTDFLERREVEQLVAHDAPIVVESAIPAEQLKYIGDMLAQKVSLVDSTASTNAAG